MSSFDLTMSSEVSKKDARFDVILIALWSPGLFADNDSSIQWNDWSAELWQQSVEEQKPIILYLEAVWCHWCHVMDKSTFKDKRIVEQLNNDYLAVKVDHDARPDLANRYRNYGWPATIIFQPDGAELLKRAGFIPADELSSLLKKYQEVDTTSQSRANQTEWVELSAQLAPGVRERLVEKHESAFDEQLGSLKLKQKFLDADSVEYALRQAALGDADEESRVRKTLLAARALVDPVWGGAYQYSSYGTWDNPHYEKLMRTQGRYLRIYSLAYQQLRSAEYAQTLTDIRAYLNTFLRSPSGTYYVSQDADLIQGEKAHDYFALGDSERRARGIPRVDKNIYADTNGIAIEGLAMMAKATADEDVLQDAIAAARAIIKSHQLPSGAFTHSAGESDALYLSDNLAMGLAFVALFEATEDYGWLGRAQKVGILIDENFPILSRWLCQRDRQRYTRKAGAEHGREHPGWTARCGSLPAQPLSPRHGIIGTLSLLPGSTVDCAV